MTLSDASRLVGYLQAFADPLPGSRPIQPDDIKPALALAEEIRSDLLMRKSQDA